MSVMATVAPSPHAVDAATPPALEVHGLSKSFGGLRVSRNIDLTVHPGERRLIIGPNGAGKTTLFSLICGEIRPDAGTVRLFGRDITGLPVHRRAPLGLVRTYQIITLFPRDTVLRNVVLASLALTARRWNPLWPLGRERDLEDQAHAALASVGLEYLTQRKLSDTSYGERRRVEIAMALVQRPKVLLLDEPFAGLSVEERRGVQKTLALIPPNISVVMIEHDMDVALDFAERVTLLHMGEIIAEGTRQEIVTHPRAKEIYLGR
jgi:branched-chain amino acid transport system ATP-binding protein